MLEEMAMAMGLGQRNVDYPNDDVLTAPGTTLDQQQRSGDRGEGGDDDTEWQLVMAGTTKGATRAMSQTQEGERHPGNPRQPPLMSQPATQPPTPQEEFSGITTALKKQGHQNYEISVVASELALQPDIQGNTTKQTAFREFATNYTQLRVYLAMVGEQKHVTMIHTLGTFYSIRTATNAYQWKVMGFIGDRKATKEPTPICLPQVKAWQWYLGHVNVDKEDFVEFFENEDNRSKWWMPSSQMTSDTKAPFLLTLPNAMGGGLYPSRRLHSNGGSHVANGRRTA
jgi:hypothetical protein